MKANLIPTRSQEDNLELLAQSNLSDAFKIIELPCIEYKELSNYQNLDNAIKKNHEYEWIIFLSKRAAEAFFNRLLVIGGNLFNLAPHIQIACIGSKTQEFITDTIGFPVDFTPSRFNTDAFFIEFKDKYGHENFNEGKAIYPPKKILLPRINVEEKIFIENLQSINFAVDEVEAYASNCPDPNKTHIKSQITQIKNCLEKKEKILISFTSPQIVQNFARLTRELNFEPDNVTFFSIGPKTTSIIKLIYHDFRIEEAEQSTIQSLIELLRKSQNLSNK